MVLYLLQVEAVVDLLQVLFQVQVAQLIKDMLVVMVMMHQTIMVLEVVVLVLLVQMLEHLEEQEVMV